MKKLISLILIAIILISVCACGKSSSTGDAESGSDGGGQVEVEIKAEFDKAISYINNNDYVNALIVLEKIPNTYSDYDTVKKHTMKHWKNIKRNISTKPRDTPIPTIMKMH